MYVFVSAWYADWVHLATRHPLGGALSAVRAQCNYFGVRLYYKPILFGTLSIIVVW